MNFGFTKHMSASISTSLVAAQVAQQVVGINQDQWASLYYILSCGVYPEEWVATHGILDESCVQAHELNVALNTLNELGVKKDEGSFYTWLDDYTSKVGKVRKVLNAGDIRTAEKALLEAFLKS